MNVELIKFNDGKEIDINDNEDFLDYLLYLGENSKGDECLEEYFNNVVYIYAFDDFYYVYFSVEKDYGVDGYVIKGNYKKDLFKYVSEKRNSNFIEEELLETCSI